MGILDSLTDIGVILSSLVPILLHGIGTILTDLSRDLTSQLFLYSVDTRLRQHNLPLYNYTQATLQQRQTMGKLPRGVSRDYIKIIKFK